MSFLLFHSFQFTISRLMFSGSILHLFPVPISHAFGEFTITTIDMLFQNRTKNQNKKFNFNNVLVVCMYLIGHVGATQVHEILEDSCIYVNYRRTGDLYCIYHVFMPAIVFYNTFVVAGFSVACWSILVDFEGKLHSLTQHQLSKRGMRRHCLKLANVEGITRSLSFTLFFIITTAITSSHAFLPPTIHIMNRLPRVI